jgi:hypothetical protein
MNPLGVFTFASPLMLLALPAAITALIYAYRRFGRGQRRVVGTLLLLKALERTATVRQQFRPPPRFFLEGILLALLSIGAAGLYRTDTAHRLLIVIDDSMSMAALPPGERENLLSRAKSSARATIESMSNDAVIGVVRTSNPTIAAPGSPEDALELIESIGPTYTPDNLERILPRLAADSRFDKVSVFTDRRPTYDQPSTRERVEVVGIAEEHSPNIAWSDISLATTPGGDKTLRATIMSYAETAATITVKAEALDPRGLTTLVGRQDVALPAKGTRSVEFTGLKSRAAAYSVSLEAESGETRRVNALSLDDAAWIGAGPASDTITVVSDLNLEALGLNRLRHLRFEVVRPAEWRTESTTAGRTVVFHRFTPPSLPRGGAMFILPPSGGPFESGDAVSAAEVTRWNVADPLATYLNFPALTFKTLTPLKSPAWARDAITTTAGVAAITGMFGGHRYIAFGFEIFPYEGSANRVLSILTLNALGWLADTTTGYEGIGSTYLPTNTTESVAYRGEKPLWSAGGSLDTPLTFDRPGLITITSRGEVPVLRAINSFDERESNLLSPAQLAIARPAPREQASRSDHALLTTTIASLALALLLLDFFLFGGRRESNDPPSGARSV